MANVGVTSNGCMSSRICSRDGIAAISDLDLVACGATGSLTHDQVDRRTKLERSEDSPGHAVDAELGANQQGLEIAATTISRSVSPSQCDKDSSAQPTQSTPTTQDAPTDWLTHQEAVRGIQHAGHVDGHDKPSHPLAGMHFAVDATTRLTDNAGSRLQNRDSCCSRPDTDARFWRKREGTSSRREIARTTSSAVAHHHNCGRLTRASRHQADTRIGSRFNYQTREPIPAPTARHATDRTPSTDAPTTCDPTSTSTAGIATRSPPPHMPNPFLGPVPAPTRR
ncbi:hypothetical protein PG991_012108 [Apiospora marii]|uniref:Uncharacterized protein n=1 Tax=Apiospora marii TaxID=335849 RepID=A0ABR1R8W3_9PEZI